jgi:hypothetical protein
VDAAEAARGIAAGQEGAQFALDVGRQPAAAVLVFETRQERLEVLAHEAMERRAGRVATKDLGEQCGGPWHSCRRGGRRRFTSFVSWGPHAAVTIGRATGCGSMT